LKVTLFVLSLLVSFEVCALPLSPTGGGSLFLKRNKIETLRAEFYAAEDCELIADAMQKKEPDVRWYCSTSEPDQVFECDIKELRPIDENGKVVDFGKELKVTMNRDQALVSFRPSVASYKAVKGKDEVRLTSDSVYPNGNSYIKVTALSEINTKTGKMVFKGTDGKKTGEANCKQL
jgi:hypothetical protein